MTNNAKMKQPRQPGKRQLPVDVRPFFRNGKRVAGYKRSRAGDKLNDTDKR